MYSEQLQRMIHAPQSWALSVTSRDWDATKTGAPAELLQRGFQLAYFLIPDHSTAVNILVRALEKIRVRSRRELKRLYWRDKHAERPVRRIARSDIDMLQWLIMFESEQEERAQERAGAVTFGDMLVRYVKHLVQITTALSSFYVNVGVTRLLHNYSTSEAQCAYEMLTSRYLGPDEYRRAKSALMDKMSRRFAGLLRLTRVDHGELRFEISQDQEQWAGPVGNCLHTFTPWSTQGGSAQFATANGGDTRLRSAYANRNENELRCCHILIEPTCYKRLMEDLAFDPPDIRLAVPRFVMPENQQKSDGSNVQPLRPPQLSHEDMEEIQRRVAHTDGRRRTMNPSIVTIVVDGVEQTQVDLTQKTQLHIALEAGASLIEIHGKDDRGDLLLATHPISYVTNRFELSRATAGLNSGTLEFEVTPIARLTQDPPRAILSLNYRPRFRWARPWLALRQLAISGRRIRAYALAGLTTALIGWGLTTAYYSHRVTLLEQELRQARRSQRELLPTAARAIISYTLTPDAQRVRGAETTGIPEVSLRLHSPAISLELPLVKTTPEGSSYSAELKTFTGDRTLMTQNFLQAMRTDNRPVVETVVPADLLKADTYYTVHLHSSDQTDHFTFKVVDNR